jgi:hypothetical protein
MLVILDLVLLERVFSLWVAATGHAPLKFGACALTRVPGRDRLSRELYTLTKRFGTKQPSSGRILAVLRKNSGCRNVK